MSSMLTIIETPDFERLWPNYWTEVQHDEFVVYISANPLAGDVIQRSGDVRKVHWKRAGSGKRGGVRVVYFTRNAAGELVLLLIYAKAKLDSIAGETLKELRDDAENGND